MNIDKKLKNILFDLGGVIVDIRRQDCVVEFEKLGFQGISEFLGDYGQKGAFLGIENGSLTPAEFREELRRHIPVDVTDAELDAAFNRFIAGVPVGRLAALRRLRSQGWKLYVVSNTNPIMWDSVLKSEFEKEGLCREDYFDGIVTSFNARCCKPARPIFEKVISDFGIIPDETLFFDDSLENCKVGETFGFHSVHVPQGSSFDKVMFGG